MRPVLAWLAPLVAAWMVIGERRLRSVALAFVLLVGTALPVGGWIYRNIGHGLPATLTAQMHLDRLFGTVAAAEKPLAGPYAPETSARLLNEFKLYAALPAQADTNTLTLLDRYGRERLNTQRARHAQAVFKSGGKVLALDHSLDLAFARLGIPYAPAGYAATLLAEPTAATTTPEPVTPWVINAWVGLNALLVAGMAVGLVMMLWHRRFAAVVLVLIVTMYFLYYGSAGGGETLRLPFIGIQGLLLAAIVAPAPVRRRKVKAAKVRKLQKLDGEAPVKNSPLATAESIRPAAGTSTDPGLSPADQAEITKVQRNAVPSADSKWRSRGDDRHDGAMPDYAQSVHPALRGGPGGRPI